MHTSVKRLPNWETMFTLFLWDRRNSGGSEFKYCYECAQTPESLQDAADLATLIKHIGSSSIILVGNSSGARCSILAALQIPAIVKGLVIINPSAGKEAATEVAKILYETTAYSVAEAGSCSALLKIPHYDAMCLQNSDVVRRIQTQDFDQFLACMSSNSKWLRSQGNTVPMIGVSREEFYKLDHIPAIVIHTAPINDKLHPQFAAQNVAACLKLSPPAILAEFAQWNTWHNPIQEFLSDRFNTLIKPNLKNAEPLSMQAAFLDGSSLASQVLVDNIESLNEANMTTKNNSEVRKNSTSVQPDIQIMTKEPTHRISSRLSSGSSTSVPAATSDASSSAFVVASTTANSDIVPKLNSKNKQSLKLLKKSTESKDSSFHQGYWKSSQGNIASTSVKQMTSSLPVGDTDFVELNEKKPPLKFNKTEISKEKVDQKRILQLNPQ